MREPMGWRPLLEGTRRDQVLEVIQALADALAAHVERTPLEDVSLAAGTSGLALLFSWLDRVEPSERSAALTARLLDASMDAVASQPLGPGLAAGFSGVAWALHHVEPSEDEDDALGEVDAAIERLLSTSSGRREFDLLAGLTGLGLYALERLPRPRAARCLAAVVARLEEQAESFPEGLVWKTRPEWMPAVRREQLPEGKYDLGVAHGLPGVIAVLAGAAAAGIAPEACRRMLDGAWRYLKARFVPGPGAHLPMFLAPGVTPIQARTTWCYGTPGAVGALHAATRALGDADWSAEVLALAREAARRPVAGSGVMDACLCHGSAGLAHLYNRLFQSTGEGVFADAAHLWLEETLRYRRPGSGIGGYAAWSPGEDGKGGWLDLPGVLGGAAGVALMLLATVHPVEPTWDRMLLMSLPEPARKGTAPI